MLNSNDRLERLAHYRMAVEGTMQVLGYTFDAENPKGPLKLQGKLLKPPDIAYRQMRAAFEKLGYTPYLTRLPGKPDQCELTVVAGVIPKTPSNPMTNLWLFLATVASVIFTGGMSDNGFSWADGLMFAGSLLGILVAHEAGHYIVGRLRGAPVSLPYFIPLPLISFIGTMGAVIVQSSGYADRKQMFDIGITGPLAGLVIAIPITRLWNVGPARPIVLPR